MPSLSTRASISLTFTHEPIGAGCTVRAAWSDSGSGQGTPHAQTMPQRVAYHGSENGDNVPCTKSEHLSKVRGMRDEWAFGTTRGLLCTESIPIARQLVHGAGSGSGVGAWLAAVQPDILSTCQTACFPHGGGPLESWRRLYAFSVCAYPRNGVRAICSA